MSIFRLVLNKMILNYFTFKLDSITCKKCDWSGLGSDLNYGEWSGEGFICEMNCPKCNEVVGFWQAPLKSEEIQ